MTRFLKLSVLGLALIGGGALTGCETNQTLGRSQFLLVDDAALEKSALAAWQEQLKTAKISKDPALNKRIQTVGARIAAASGLGAGRRGPLARTGLARRRPGREHRAEARGGIRPGGRAGLGRRRAGAPADARIAPGRGRGRPHRLVAGLTANARAAPPPDAGKRRLSRTE